MKRAMKRACLFLILSFLLAHPVYADQQMNYVQKNTGDITENVNQENATSINPQSEIDSVRIGGILKESNSLDHIIIFGFILVATSCGIYIKRKSLLKAIKSYPKVIDKNDAVKLAQRAVIGGVIYVCIGLVAILQILPFFFTSEATLNQKIILAAWGSLGTLTTSITVWSLCNLRGNLIATISFSFFILNIVTSILIGLLGVYWILIYYLLGKLMFDGVLASWYLRKNPFTTEKPHLFEKGAIKEWMQRIRKSFPSAIKKLLTLLPLSILIFVFLVMLVQADVLSKYRLMLDFSAGFFFLLIAVFSKSSAFWGKAIGWMLAFTTWFAVSQFLNLISASYLLLMAVDVLSLSHLEPLNIFSVVSSEFLVIQYVDIFATFVGMFVQLKVQSNARVKNLEIKFLGQIKIKFLGQIIGTITKNFKNLLGDDIMKPNHWRGLTRVYGVINLFWILFWTVQYFDEDNWDQGEAFFWGSVLPIVSFLAWPVVIWVWRGFLTESKEANQH